MAYLARRGDVHAVVTEDSDLLAYACPRLVRARAIRACTASCLPVPHSAAIQAPGALPPPTPLTTAAAAATTTTTTTTTPPLATDQCRVQAGPQRRV